MALAAGRLRERIQLQTNTPTRGTAGSEVPAWATTVTVWAERNDLSGSELIAAQQVSSLVSTVFRIRYRADVTAKMRVVHGSQTFDLEYPMDPTGRREILELYCKRNAE